MEGFGHHINGQKDAAQNGKDEHHEGAKDARLRLGGGEGAHEQAEADGSKSRSQSGKDEGEMVAAQFEGRHAIDEGQEIHAGEYHERQLKQTDGGIDHDFAPQDGEIGDGQGADAVVGAFVALGEHAARERNDDEKHGEEGKGRHVVLHEGGFDDGVFALGVALGDEDEVVVFEVVVEFDAFAQVFGEVEFHFAGLGINFEVGGQVAAHAFLEFVGERLLHHLELPEEIVFNGGLELGVELGGESLEEGVEDDFDFKERLEEMNEELETLNAEARELEDRIAENVAKLLE